jgi:hypothetical protein
VQARDLSLPCGSVNSSLVQNSSLRNRDTIMARVGDAIFDDLKKAVRAGTFEKLRV